MTEQKIQNQVNAPRRSTTQSQRVVVSTEQFSSMTTNQQQEYINQVEEARKNAHNLLNPALADSAVNQADETYKKIQEYGKNNNIDMDKLRAVDISKSLNERSEEFKTPLIRKPGREGLLEEKERMKRQHQFSRDLDQAEKAFGIEMGFFDKITTSTEERIKDVQDAASKVAPLDSKHIEAIRGISADVANKFNQQRNDLLSKFEDLQIIDINNDGTWSVATDTIETMNNVQTGNLLGNSFSLPTLDGKQGQFVKNVAGAYGYESTTGGEWDESKYGGNTAYLAEKAGVNKDLLYGIASVNNVWQDTKGLFPGGKGRNGSSTTSTPDLTNSSNSNKRRNQKTANSTTAEDIAARNFP